ncbi:hypothetical protein L1S34_14150 [Flavobacterium sp. K77]|uniref:hypothetical protein n=1 Tax=Flavobacterium sp. K77 TaxID=2910676 RepID=UPI001F439F19|nr:hypothetical protein [Flavobacterium sp. K77]MCF6142434.1 hypothetical protein [Flavobacterium sp. K77]
MRKEIYITLLKSKSDFDEIISSYVDVLPQSILDGSKNLFEVEIPKFVNDFLETLNAVESSTKFDQISTVEDAITVFENPVLDAIILAAINSEAVSSDAIKGFSTVKDNLEASKLILQTHGALLTMQLMGGKLANGELER